MKIEIFIGLSPEDVKEQIESFIKAMKWLDEEISIDSLNITTPDKGVFCAFLQYSLIKE